MGRLVRVSLLCGWTLFAGGPDQAAAETRIEGYGRFGIEYCEPYNPSISGTDGDPWLSRVLEDEIMLMVACADPQDPSVIERVETVVGSPSASGFEGRRLSVLSGNQLPEDVREVVWLRDGVAARNATQVTFREWLDLDPPDPAFGPEETVFTLPLSLGGRTWTTVLSLASAGERRLLAVLGDGQGMEVAVFDGDASWTPSLGFTTPKLLPGGATADGIGAFRGTDDGEAYAELKDSSLNSLGVYWVPSGSDPVRVFGDDEPTESGTIQDSRNAQFDVTPGVGYFVSGVGSAAIWRRALPPAALLSTLTFEDSFDDVLGLDAVYDPTRIQGPSFLSGLVSVSSGSGALGYRFSPLTTVLRTGDPLDGKTVQVFEIGTHGRAGDVAIARIFFTDFTSAYYVITNSPQQVPALTLWPGALLVALLLGATALHRARR